MLVYNSGVSTLRQSEAPVVAIVGNLKTSTEASVAAKDLGRALAKSGFRILVYSSGADFLEVPIVEGYIDSQVAKPRSIQVRYPLHGQKPAFREQQTHEQVFDWRPDRSLDWEISFYHSLSEVDGILLLGGGDSTMIAGVVAMGHRMAIVALAAFGGEAAKVWEALQPGRDLPSADEISLMGRPWSSDLADEVVQTLTNQLSRPADEEQQRRLEELRAETSIKWHAIVAVVLFLLAMICVPLAWGSSLDLSGALWLLFFSPSLAGVSGSTIRLVFDLHQGAMPLTSRSTITTAALGLIAGGVAGLLFITAQISIVSQAELVRQASRLVPFGVAVGFIAGLTLDAVFRKLISSDVVDLRAVDPNQRS